MKSPKTKATASIIETNLSQQVQEDYLSYSMAVLVGRAIPLLTDGLKPVQRRIMTAMKWLNLRPDGRYMKSARVEGEVMGKLHPHGSAYGAMVTMAAPWNNNLPLIDGHGNWGSSTDNAAASRYTESKLSNFSWDILLDDSDTWRTIPNYDGSLQEPIELNTKIPTVFLNGQDGIGVGFATKIPPHSLRDICDAVTKGSQLIPSFPTGCDIVKDEGLQNYIDTGIGSIRCRAKCEISKQEKSGRKQARDILTFTNLPPAANPEKIGQQVAAALEKGSLSGISEVIDESDLAGDRITIVTKPNVDGVALSKQLFYHTDLDTKFSARTLVIDGVKPVELSPHKLIEKWKTWRIQVLERKFSHELNAKEARLEIVMGLLKAIDKIDLVIKVIRASKSPKEALEELVSNRTLKYTPDQAKAILDMKLRALTNLDSEELNMEETSLKSEIERLTVLVKSEKERHSYMVKEIKAIGVRHGEKRRSEIIDIPDSVVLQRSSSPKQPVAAKPRFVKVDNKKGLVEQVKGPRGAIVLDAKDKLILMTEDGTLKKVPANFKGAISSGYSPVSLAKRENDVSSRKFLAVFELSGDLRAVVLNGEELCKSTSKGKKWLPDEAKLVYFGEGKYTVSWVSERKKPLTLDLSVKSGRPGSKGVKVGNSQDIMNPGG